MPMGPRHPLRQHKARLDNYLINAFFISYELQITVIFCQISDFLRPDNFPVLPGLLGLMWNHVGMCMCVFSTLGSGGTEGDWQEICDSCSLGELALWEKGGPCSLLFTLKQIWNISPHRQGHHSLLLSPAWNILSGSGVMPPRECVLPAKPSKVSVLSTETPQTSASSFSSWGAPSRGSWHEDEPCRFPGPLKWMAGVRHELLGWVGKARTVPSTVEQTKSRCLFQRDRPEQGVPYGSMRVRDGSQQVSLVSTVTPKICLAKS